MFLPKSYDSALSNILDTHAKHGVIPGEYVVQYLEIKKDFEAYFQKNKLKPNRILDIGGRSLPYAYKKNLSVDTYDPRPVYHRIIKDLSINVQAITLNKLDITQYDLILIHREIGGLQGIDQQLITLNTKFHSGIPVYAYDFNLRQDSFGLMRYNDDGSKLDCLAAQNFFKKISGHMHMGISSYDYKNVTFFDLTRDY